MEIKTHAILLTTAQFRRLNQPDLTVNFGNDEQRSSNVERLLGLQLHENLKFGEYIMNNEKSLLKGLNTRLNALKMRPISIGREEMRGHSQCQGHILFAD